MVPSWQMGINVRPFSRILVTSSRVRPLGTRGIKLGYTGLTGFHNISGKRGRVL